MADAAPLALTPPVFNGTVAQCKDVTVSWTGGQFPVRVSAFYQNETSSDWLNAGLPSEASDSSVISWTANVPAGSYAWITLVDHTGTYRQSTTPALVESSDDSSCLNPINTANVVTQTVYMSQSGQRHHASSSSLDDKTLLIVAVVFGVLFFLVAAGLLYVYSLLRQSRRARLRGPRFSLAEEVEDDESAFGSSATGRSASVLVAGGAYRPDSRLSEIDNEKQAPSPTSTHGEKNPFLDPPLASGERRPSSIRSDTTTSTTNYPVTRSFSVKRPEQQRLELHKSPSAVESLNSATSMQLFGTNGGLRVTNDAANISTPMLSRVHTNTSESRYATLRTNDQSSYSSMPGGGAGDMMSQVSERLNSYSSDHGTFMSTGSGSTADHYTDEPHSSRSFLKKGGSRK